MGVKVIPFGNLDEQPVRAFVLTAGAASVEIIEYGARLRRCLVPDAGGGLADIALGFDTLEDYVERGGSTGAICGRYGGRIASGRFAIDGVSHQLAVNEPPNSLHGGFRQYARYIWRGEPLPEDNAVRLTLESPDGDEGYPGRVLAEVTYRLIAASVPELTISMRATADRPTYVNLIYHGYWNLRGHATGLVEDHLLRLRAGAYLPVGADRIPTGERRNVAGTPFDFREPRRIGADIAAVAPGYDNTFCLDDFDRNQTRSVLRLADPGSGRAMELATDQPGVQFYTANQWRKPPSAKEGATYHAHQGAAFETGQFPNSPNTPDFNPRPLRPGATYRHEMAMRFPALERDGISGFFGRPW